jgi:hypothetical protein
MLPIVATWYGSPSQTSVGAARGHDPNKRIAQLALETWYRLLRHPLMPAADIAAATLAWAGGRRDVYGVA